MMTVNRRIVALLVMIGSFSILTFLVWNGETNSFDVELRNWALSLNTPTLVMLWELISVLGSVAVLSGLTFLSLTVLAMRRDWKACRQLALVMGGAVVFNALIKWTVHRPRPAEVYANTMPTSYSFPSGHALFSLAFYMSVAWLVSRQSLRNWKNELWVAAVLMVASIGASRVFLGVHYGSDVLGGYLISAAWLMLLATLTHMRIV